MGTRRSGDEIMALLRRHLVDNVPVSEVCEKAGVNPSQFYRWLRMLLDGGAVVFDRGPERGAARQIEAAEAKAEALEQKLQKKHEVLSELMEEHIRLKKTLGES
jgi:transposase-like protein